MKNHVQFGAKRAVDLVGAAVGLMLLVPLFTLIALAIKLDSRGGVFFTQERIGRNGRRFRIFKFRTMLERAEEMGSGFYVGLGDPRITPVGRFLRRFSLDELPQLIQVLTGQMSLVGPRPALPYQLQYYSARDMKRLLLRPGLTGWSQVSGRNLLSWPERLQKDVWYFENFSLTLDFLILLRTLAVWISGEGLYGTREKFFFKDDHEIPLATKKEQPWMS